MTLSLVVCESWDDPSNDARTWQIVKDLLLSRVPRNAGVSWGNLYSQTSQGVYTYHHDFTDEEAPLFIRALSQLANSYAVRQASQIFILPVPLTVPIIDYQVGDDTFFIASVSDVLRRWESSDPDTLIAQATDYRGPETLSWQPPEYGEGVALAYYLQQIAEACQEAQDKLLPIQLVRH